MFVLVAVTRMRDLHILRHQNIPCILNIYVPRMFCIPSTPVLILRMLSITRLRILRSDDGLPKTTNLSADLIYGCSKDINRRIFLIICDTCHLCMFIRVLCVFDCGKNSQTRLKIYIFVNKVCLCICTHIWHVNSKLCFRTY